MNKRELAKLYREMRAAERELWGAQHAKSEAERIEDEKRKQHEEIRLKLLAAARSIRQPIVIDGKVITVGNDRQELYLKIENAKII